MSVIKPQNQKEVADAVLHLVQAKEPLEILGGASRRTMGQPLNSNAVLDLSALSGLSLYEPEELVLSAMAGTPMSVIENTLAENGQELAFEPADLRALLGLEDFHSTLGGTIATDLSGPRRIKAGAARDHFLGVEAVSGRGEVFKSGGRVVKNVTGYDMCKILTGSWGTLAVMTKLTLKVLPKSETEKTILLMGLAPQDAVEVMCNALGSALDVSGCSYVPKDLVKISGVRVVSTGSASVTALRLEGIEASVNYRVEKLKALMSKHDSFRKSKPTSESRKGESRISDSKKAEIVVIDASDSKTWWREVRDVRFFLHSPHRAVWRISVPPAQGARVKSSIDNELPNRAFFDWSGGLIWLETEVENLQAEQQAATLVLDNRKVDSQLTLNDAGASVIRRAIDGAGGHATLVVGPRQLRENVDVFQPQSSGVTLLSQRIKESFDPYKLLNPGRMVRRSN